MANFSFEMSDQLNRDDDDDEDADDVKRQHELLGMLSDVFDDISPLTSEDDDDSIDCAGNVIERSKEYDKIGEYFANKTHYELTPKNGLSNVLTSTPRLTIPQNGVPSFKSSNHKKFVPNNDAIDEEFPSFERRGDKYNGIDLMGENAKQRNSSVSFENGRDNHCSDALSKFSSKELFNHSHVQMLLDDNQRLSNEILILKQQLSAANGDFEGLQFKYKECEKMNKLKDNEIVRLEGRVKTMEVQLNVEKEAKEEYQRKLLVSDETIESLQYQLMEIERSDCLVRAKEIHESTIDKLKREYEEKVVILNGEIQGLRHEFDLKNREILTLKKHITTLQREKNDHNVGEHFKEMIQMTKELWEKEMRIKIESEMKTLLQSTKEEHYKDMREELTKERKVWDKQLQKEIAEIIKKLKIKAKICTEESDSNISINLVPLLELWNILEKSCEEKERVLGSRIEELRDAKRQLENVLEESKLNTSDGGNESVMNELRCVLQQVKEESEMMRQKLHKYKLHYHQLVKKHKYEIERLEREFANILSQKFVENFK